MEISMNKTQKHIDTWLSLNKLTINLRNTNYLIIIKLNHLLNNNVIIQTNSIKLFGVIINTNIKLETTN